MRALMALCVQVLAVLICVALAKYVPALTLGLWQWLGLQAMIAAIISYCLRQPTWWLLIHLVFFPLAIGFWYLHLPNWFYLLAAVLMILMFWGTIKGDVPLFLSSSAVVDAVALMVRQEGAIRLVELGAGIGSVAVPLAHQCPALEVMALELAPLPWLVCRVRGGALKNLSVLRQSLWVYDLAQADIGFAFLSPDPMPRLAEKLQREMRSGSLFISSSFPVPGWNTEKLLQLSDRAKTKLYCYRIP